MVVQHDALLALSTVLVAPTSRAAQPATFRPQVSIEGTTTRVLPEQIRALDVQRLGREAGRLSPEDLDAVDRAIRLVFGLGRP